MLSNHTHSSTNGVRVWHTTASMVILAAYLLVAMEWLFFVTKLSFLSILGWPLKLEILGLAPLPFVVVGLAVVLIGLLLGRTFPRAGRVAHMLALCPVVVFVGSLLILLLDNFTNTVFGFGVQKSVGHSRWVYVAVFVLLFVFAAGLVRNATQHLQRNDSTRWGHLSTTLVSVSVLVLLASFVTARKGESFDPASFFPPATAAERRPNILLISGDGLDAVNMSAYGYERFTTPFLSRKIPESLFCENAFANSAHTTGSLMSILTGRLPSQTRVIYPPDILTGLDSHRHLPGLLRALGYRNLHISIRHYADAYDLNLRGGFDSSTFQRHSSLQLSSLLGEAPGYFVTQTIGRVRDRFLHVLGIASMPAAFVEVQQQGHWRSAGRRRRSEYGDMTRVRALLDFIRRSPQPFMAHVHFVGTHGPLFPVTRPVHSRGQTQSSPWMVDFYDDAILEFDYHLSSIVSVLETEGTLSNTILVIHSDHGSQFDNRKRTPLVFLFPRGEHHGRIRANVQNLDIAPTLLDYMGVPRPEWMSGRSLLESKAERLRPIFSFQCDPKAIQLEANRAFLEPASIRPPFYSLGRVTMIVCNRAYTLDLNTHELETLEAEGHTGSCRESELPALEEAQRMIVDHLEDSGYEVSALRGALSSRPSRIE